LRNVNVVIVKNTFRVTLLATEDFVAVANTEGAVAVAVADIPAVPVPAAEPAAAWPPAAVADIPVFGSGKAIQCKPCTSSEHALPTCPQLHLRK